MQALRQLLRKLGAKQLQPEQRLQEVHVHPQRTVTHQLLRPST